MRSIDRKLLKASSAGSLRDVERLLKRGADANAADSSGWTPLYAASSWGHDDVVRALLAAVARGRLGRDRPGRRDAVLLARRRRRHIWHTSTVDALLKAGAAADASVQPPGR